MEVKKQMSRGLNMSHKKHRRKGYIYSQRMNSTVKTLCTKLLPSEVRYINVSISEQKWQKALITKDARYVAVQFSRIDIDIIHYLQRQAMLMTCHQQSSAQIEELPEQGICLRPLNAFMWTKPFLQLLGTALWGESKTHSCSSQQELAVM